MSSITITACIETKGSSEICSISADQTAAGLLLQLMGEEGGDYDICYMGNTVSSNTTLSSLGIMDGEEVEVVIGKKMSAKLFLQNEGFQVSGAAFIQAVESNTIRLVQKFIDAGIDVDYAGDDDRTALLIASISGNSDILEILLQNGADVNRATRLH